MSGPAEAGLHGGRLNAARRQFPDAPEPFIDLSTGISPRPYPYALPAQDAFTRLPEPEVLDDLLDAAAWAYGAASPALLAAAPGTQSLIGLLPLLWPQRRVMVLGPTYSEHAAAWQRAGARVDVVREWRALENAGCAVLCNPNNPDGRRVPPSDVMALADRLGAMGGLLVVDEAFADFESGLSVVPFLPHPALIVLRSFGKAYGLAGLRLGFAAAAVDRIARLRQVLGAWPVSGMAAVIGITALRDAGWRRRAAGMLAAASARLDGMLAPHGTVLGGTVLFRLVRHRSAAGLFHHLGRAGILVRRFDFDQEWLRFGIPGDESHWMRLESALRDWHGTAHPQSSPDHA